ncbi:MAG: tripartite tricarboxylate transporter TctB family protein [Candidatus Rokuibacteriota bacterium]
MRKADVIVALALCGMAGVVLVEGLRLGLGWSTDGPKPGFFVFYLGLALALSSGVVLLQTMVRRAAPLYRRRFVEAGQFVPVAKVLVPAGLMVLLIHVLGLYVAGALYLAVYMRWIGRHSMIVTVLLSVAIPVVTFLVFEMWFLVPMPKGPLEALLGY